MSPLGANCGSVGEAFALTRAFARLTDDIKSRDDTMEPQVVHVREWFYSSGTASWYLTVTWAALVHEHGQGTVIHTVTLCLLMSGSQ